MDQEMRVVMSTLSKNLDIVLIPTGALAILFLTRKWLF